MAKEKAVKEKPLDKMTAKELRDVAAEIPEITGIHGMNKDELLAEIKKAKGIEDKNVGKKNRSARVLKQKIQALKVLRQEALSAKDGQKATILRRKISRLKKKTRRLAA